MNDAKILAKVLGGYNPLNIIALHFTDNNINSTSN